MPLYTYKCPLCNTEVERLVKVTDSNPICPTCISGDGPGHVNMQRILSTPSAPQWNCRTAHSRSKGF